jgi:molybdopterin molybdotransferase
VSENFAVRTVAEAVEGFRPAHVTAPRRVPLSETLGLAAASDVPSPVDLPGFRRSAVDGYAVRAADSPSHRLTVAGAVRVGEPPATSVLQGQAVVIPTGGAVPNGADAVVMVEQTAVGEEGMVEILCSVVSGENVVRADEDVVAGSLLVSAGSVVRPQDIGLLAAAGVVELEVHPRPLVAVVSTGDELIDAAGEPLAAQVRDVNTPALSALLSELGGNPLPIGIVPDNPAELERVCRDALDRCDLLVVSAGSSVGTRDATALVVSRLGRPGIWCHGLAVRPGRPTLLAEVLGRPVIGLPGNPIAALVIMRLLGAVLLARLAGHDHPPSRPTRQARLAREIVSRVGRTDVVQVAISGGDAVPLAGKSARLSVMGQADGYLLVADDVELLTVGSTVDVLLYR